MNQSQREWILVAAKFAKDAGHVFPEMAGCEAALESGYGISGLARMANNVFGMKQHVHPIFGTLSLPTKEFLDGDWKIVSAEWVKYPSLQEAFEDRMETLTRLRGEYPHYAAALAAATPQLYVLEVSKSWSTSPTRSTDCIDIYNEIFVNAGQPQPPMHVDLATE